MFPSQQYRFEIHAHHDGTAASFRTLKEHLEPRLSALANCFDAETQVYSLINGAQLDDETIDWSDNRPNRYQFCVVYSGIEESPLNVDRIRQAIDALRRYHGLRWYQDHVKTV